MYQDGIAREFDLVGWNVLLSPWCLLQVIEDRRLSNSALVSGSLANYFTVTTDEIQNKLRQPNPFNSYITAGDFVNVSAPFYPEHEQ